MSELVKNVNNKIGLLDGKVATMSTVEIAELCEKRHDNVMRVANSLAERGIILSPQIEEMFSMGRGGKNRRKIYNLDKTESLNLVANLSPQFTAKIIDRWLELEGSQNKGVAIPQTMEEALQIALDTARKNKELEGKLAKAEPQVQALKRLAESKGGFTVTVAATVLKIKRTDLFGYLQSNGWAYRSKNKWRPNARYTKSGHLDCVVSTFPLSDGRDMASEQMLITPLGMARLSYAFEVDTEYTELYHRNGHPRAIGGDAA